MQEQQEAVLEEEHPGHKVQDPATSALDPAADAAAQAG